MGIIMAAGPGYRYFVCYRIIPRTWFGRAKWGNVIAQSEVQLSTEPRLRYLEERIASTLPLKFWGCRVITVNFQLLAEVEDISDLEESR